MINAIFKPTLENLYKAIRNGNENSVIAMRAVLEEMGFMTERFAKQLTPVKTGMLRSSIGVESDLATKGMTVRVGTHGVRYARFVHDGTRKMRSRPFLEEGKNLTIQRFNGFNIPQKLDKAYIDAFRRL